MYLEKAREKEAVVSQQLEQVPLQDLWEEQMTKTLMSSWELSEHYYLIDWKSA